MAADTITRKSLSPIEGELLTTLSGEGHDLFTVRDAEAVLGKSNAAIRKLLHGLARRGWLQRIEKGKYLIVPLSAGVDGHYAENELVVASHLVSPYYLSYWTALSHYGLTEQPSRTVYVATPKRRRPLTLHGVTYRFVTLTLRKFFGETRVWIGDRQVLMADRSKTLIDCLDHPELCGGAVEAAKGLWHARGETDWARVAGYAHRLGNGAILKRLGYLLEALDLVTPEFCESLRGSLTAGYIALDPLSPPAGKHNARWRLLVNVDDATLTGWRET